MEIITSFLTAEVAAYVGSTGLVAIIAYVLRKIPNEKIKIIVGEASYKLGVVVTLGLSKWKYTKGFWNKIVEPWFVDLLDNVVGEAVKQFIAGLRSDNDK